MLSNTKSHLGFRGFYSHAEELAVDFQEQPTATSPAIAVACRLPRIMPLPAKSATAMIKNAFCYSE